MYDYIHNILDFRAVSFRHLAFKHSKHALQNVHG